MNYILSITMPFVAYFRISVCHKMSPLWIKVLWQGYFFYDIWSMFSVCYSVSFPTTLTVTVHFRWFDVTLRNELNIEQRRYRKMNWYKDKKLWNLALANHEYCQIKQEVFPSQFSFFLLILGVMSSYNRLRDFYKNIYMSMQTKVKCIWYRFCSVSIVT